MYVESAGDNAANTATLSNILPSSALLPVDHSASAGQLSNKWHFSDIKPQFRITAVVLDTVRAVSDDRSTSSTPYNTSPTRIVSTPRLSWIGSIQGTFAFSTSADTILDLPAYERIIYEFDACERVIAPAAPSSSAGASCMTCIATIHTARAGLLQQHDTERDALRDYKATARLFDAPRAYDLTPMLYHVHTHLTSAHHRYAGAVVPRCARCPRQRRSSAHCSWICDTIPLHPFPITYAVSLATRPRRPSLGPPHSLLPRRLVLSRSASHGRRASPASALVVPVALIAARHTPTVFSRIPPSPLGACASVHPQPGVHDYRPPRLFLLAGVPLVASALAATSSAPSHSKPASATQQKHDAQPQCRLQHLQHRFAYLLRWLRRLTACCDVPHGILTLALPASACRTPPIQCASPAAAPFSASPRAATILAASGSKHSMRRTPDMHPHSLFPSPTLIVSLPPRRPSASSQARHSSPTRTSVLSAPPPLAQRAAPGSEEGQCGRLQREIVAHTQREDTPQWAPVAIAGTVRA
ncbi:hypothetical protein B0H14DRAFT_3886639 [Mycena olivaceomarginata]|nr:hypothetical protein B0H14DRAFT_3886639 [Mycena olivaceomarginata]